MDSLHALPRAADLTPLVWLARAASLSWVSAQTGKGNELSPFCPMTSSPPLTLDMPAPTAGELKAARIAAGLSQVQAAELMGYPVQQGSRGGLQSRTWQALESETDERTMQGPVFAMFLLLTGQHPTHALVNKT